MKRLNKLQKKFLKQVRERIVTEWLNGFLDKAGTRHAPVSMREAVRKWTAQKERFSKAMFDPDIIERFQLDLDEPIPQKWRKYTGTPLGKPVQKETVVTITFTKAEAELILETLEVDLSCGEITPEYVDTCKSIISKLSRPTTPAKRPTTLAEGRRHRPTKRKSNESKVRK